MFNLNVKQEHWVKLGIAAASAASGAVFAIVDPTGSSQASEVIGAALVFVGGLFGTNELTQHRQSFK